ncbi:MAG: hypothetical protein ACSHYA_00790 [Opitutaceae bacterium]
MIINKTSLLTLGASLSLACSSFALVDLSVDSVVSSVGTTTPKVNVGPTAGDTATYNMGGFESDGTTPLDAFFTVELIDFDNVSLHRIDLGQSATNFIATAITAENAGDAFATYRFSFFEDDAGSLGAALALETIVQVLDIDDVESVTVDLDGFENVGLSGSTNLTQTPSGASDLTIGSGVNNSPKLNPDHAVNFYSKSVTSFEITIAGIDLNAGQSREFQYDFNNPPTVDLPDEELNNVPEASNFALLAGLSAIAAVAVRRRS